MTPDLRQMAFLRAVNVGGHVVKMARLVNLFEEMGFFNVETFLASGNVIFQSKVSDSVALTHQIEQELAAELGYPVAVFLRTASEIAKISAYPAFNQQRVSESEALNVVLLKEPLSQNQLSLLADFETEVDTFHCHGRELYWACRVRQSDSEFSNALFERKLNVQATFRGMNTLQRLVKKTGL